MNYSQSYRFLFTSPKWAQNLLICTLGQFVPILGPIIVNGYHFEIIEGMHLRGESVYPDFDFNRFLSYLMRGLWVWLVQLILFTPFILIAVVLEAGALLAAFWLSSGDPSGGSYLGVVISVVLVAFLLLLLGALVILPLLLTPMSLRAGLAQEFGAAFSWEFIRDFIRRTWFETLVANLFLTVTGTLVVFLGMLVLFVGVYPASALVEFAQAHLYHQLYELYLKRGGMAIPLKRSLFDQIVVRGSR
jgi:Protein of unknown function (DUF4013)